MGGGVSRANKEAELQTQILNARQKLTEVEQQRDEARRELERLRALVAESAGTVVLPVTSAAATAARQVAVPTACQGPPVAGPDKDGITLHLLPQASAPVALPQLPPVIQDLHGGMPPEVAAAPMRLMRIAAVVAWGGRLKVYEDVQPSECVELPYPQVTEEQWAATVVLSWRWGAPKPSQCQPGFSPMSASQSEEFVAALRRMSDAGLTFAWIDWCCVPQYSASSMVEVLRSKVFYARARAMLVLPTFHPLPTEGIIRPLLVRTQQLLQQQAAPAAAAQSEGGSSSLSDAQAAAAALDCMLSKGYMACREYFSRVWTLAERLARYGRAEPLSHWVSLEAWLGMLADAVLTAAGVPHACHGQQGGADPHSTVALYRKILDTEPAAGGATGPAAAGAGSALLEATMPLLSAAAATGSLLGDSTQGLDARCAELMLLGTRLWRASRLEEGPSPSWLLGYLADMQAGVYQAWSDADRVWAVYSYFCWKRTDVASAAALAEAVKDLVSVAGGGAHHLAAAGSKLGLGAQQVAAIAQVLCMEDLRKAELARSAALGKQLVGLAAAGDVAEVRRLIEEGAALNTTDEAGRTALGAAAERGHTEVVRLLLEAGADMTKGAYGRSALHVAAEYGQTEVAKLLLAAGAEVEKAGVQIGRTVLHVAAKHGHAGVVALLLAAGADKDKTDEDGLSALHMAALNGHAEVLKVLLAAGADKDATDSDGRTPLLMALEEDDAVVVVTLLLDAGADVNKAAADGTAPLHTAAEQGQTEVVRWLLAAGADVHKEDSYGTPLCRAVAGGHVEVTQALLEAGAKPDQADADGQQPFVVAAEQGHADIVQLLLAAGADTHLLADEDGRTPLHTGTRKGNLALVHALLATAAAGACGLDQVDKSGRTPLLLAVEGGNTELVQLLLKAGAGQSALGSDAKAVVVEAAEKEHKDIFRVLLGHPDVLKLLLRAGGADVNAVDAETGWTPLYTAASKGHAGAVALLLAAGADVSAADGQSGSTALFAAASRGHTEIVESLVRAGANADAVDRHRRTALMCAAGEGNTRMVELLLQSGAKVTHTSRSGRTALHEAAEPGQGAVLELLLAAGADKSSMDDEGQSPIHIAAKNRHVQVVQALLAAGDEVDRPDERQRTPLIIAAEDGSKELVQVLLQAGANTGLSDKYGRAPLHVATAKRHTEVVQALLSAGAEVDQPGDLGQTPLMIAAADGSRALQLLLDGGADVNMAGGLHNRTALICAASRGQTNMVEQLLKAGADIHAVDENNATALHAAAEEGHVWVVEALLAAGADKSRTNKDGQTPLQVAKRHVSRIAELLSE